MLAYYEFSQDEIIRYSKPYFRNRCWWDSAIFVTRIHTIAVNEKRRLYDIYIDGKFMKQFQVPEIYFKVMEDVENGSILRNNIEPNLQIKFTKNYEAYVEPKNNNDA